MLNSTIGCAALRAATAASLVVAIVAGCETGPTAPPAARPAVEIPRITSADPWEAAGQRTLIEALRRQTHGLRARNVILFVGDGMSVDTVTAARIYAGQQLGGSGEEHVLSFERFPYTGLIKTYNTNQQTPDSAGTGTAMMTGRKTKAGVIGVGERVIPNDCESGKANRLESLLERAENAGLATGIVTTTRITHATPAAGYAHVPHRGWEYDKMLPPGATGCRDIARQLVEFDAGDGLEVVFGGGRAYFLPEQTADPEDTDKTGARADGRNLVDEWQQRFGANAHYFWNAAQFAAWQPAAGDKALGLFEASHLEFEADRETDAGGEPSLSALTAKSIRALQAQDAPGFVLFVEGGRIDHAHHFGNAARALVDAVEFGAAVDTARALTDPNDTLIVVTADHAHALAMLGYATRGHPILAKANGNGSNGEPSPTDSLDAAGKPYTTLQYTSGPGARQRAELAGVDTTDTDFLQPALLPMDYAAHSPTDVAVYADGPAAQLLVGVNEQNYIYHVLRYALGL